MGFRLVEKIGNEGIDGLKDRAKSGRRQSYQKR